MPNMTLSLDEETHRSIRHHKSINWSEVAREAFKRKLQELHIWDSLLVDSTMTDDDAVLAGDEAKDAIIERLGW